MAIRYTDLDPTTSGARDFIIRKRSPSILQMFVIFLSAVLIAVGVTITAGNKDLLIAMILVVLSTIGWYVMLQTQRNRDLLLATEFQNALFASALGINNKFCIIIKRDGNIVYIDRSFQEMFPEFLRQPRRSIDVLLDQGRVSRPDSEKIFLAIEQGVYEKVVFDIRGTGNEYHRIIMSIEPIMRPSGFIMLRGREFIETRTTDDDAAKSSGLLNKSTITLFSHVMDTMNMGVYMTGPSGSFIYTNPVLDLWLGYSDGEVMSNNLSLQDVIHQGGDRVESIEPDDYEGDVMLKKKTGGLMRCFINQKIIRDEQNKVLGCTALVHNFVEQNSTTKKKLW